MRCAMRQLHQGWNRNSLLPLTTFGGGNFCHIAFLFGQQVRPWFLRVAKKMILDVCFLHSTDSNCGRDRNASTGPTLLEFIFASQTGAH
jgi:hypothetical protein